MKLFSILLLTPPGFNLLLLILAYGVMYFSARIGKRFMLYALCIFYLMTTPLFMLLIAKFVEHVPTLATCDQKADAIVLLGGGNWATPEYPDSPRQPSPTALQRLQYAAYIQQKTNLPIIASGGGSKDPKYSESRLFANLLKTVYQNDNVIEENESRNTKENAAFVKKIADQKGFKSIYLVTSAFHMNRATYIFEHYGFKVIPAATAYFSKQTPSPFYKLFIPSGQAIMRSQMMLLELIGVTAYKIRGEVY